jgi:hypothetical protein
MDVDGKRCIRNLSLCQKHPDNEQTLQMTCVSHLRCICKCQPSNRRAKVIFFLVRIDASRSAQQNRNPPEIPMPSRENTVSLMDRGVA